MPDLYPPETIRPPASSRQVEKSNTTKETRPEIERILALPFLFIVGRPRTGTTLLRVIFDAHPNVIVPPECQFVVNLYSKYGRKKFWDVKLLERFIQDLAGQWRIEMWNLEEDQLRRNLYALQGKHSYGDICKAVYASYPSLFPNDGLKLLGDKNPGYTIYTQRLLKIFPDARFIYINRDYRDNYVSIREVGFDLAIPSLPAQKWKYFYRKIHRDAALNPSRYHFVRYEDLVMRPEETVRGLCTFAGIPYHPAMLEYHRKKEEFTRDYPPGVLQKYHSGITHGIYTHRLEIWRERLTPRQVRLLDATVGKLAAEAGYGNSYSGGVSAAALAALPGRFLAAGLAIATRVVDKLPAGIRMNILSKGPRAAAMLIYRVFRPQKLEAIRRERPNLLPFRKNQAHEPFATGSVACQEPKEKIK